MRRLFDVRVSARMISRAHGRASLLTETVLSAVEEFGIDCSELHKTRRPSPSPETASKRPPRPRGRAVSVVTHGHNKDFRPDLRQLVYVLTVATDGAVPVALAIAVEEAAAAALRDAGASRWVGATVSEETEVSFSSDDAKRSSSRPSGR
jgi:hypothetical protein